MITNVGGTGGAVAQSDDKFLTLAAVKLGIDGGQVSASFSQQDGSFTLTGKVKDKFDFDGSNKASATLGVSKSLNDTSNFFVSGNSTVNDGDVADTYSAGVKYVSDVDGKKRSGQISVSNKNGDTSYQAKGSLVDALSENTTLTGKMQFDYNGDQFEVKQSAEMVVSVDDGLFDSVTVGEYIDTTKGSGVTLSTDISFSDDLSGSIGVGLYDDGSSLVSAGVSYATSENTSLYANGSSYEQENADISYGAQVGVKTKIGDNLDFNVGGFIGDYTEFKDAAAPKSYEDDSGVFANISWKF